jgi:hypothetical protein
MQNIAKVYVAKVAGLYENEMKTGFPYMQKPLYAAL